MKSKLTNKQQKAICSQLGSVKLNLLYKASIHGFTGAAFHKHCDDKSPTVSVGYNKSGYVFGGYTKKPFSRSGQWVKDDQAFLFSFSGKKLNKYPVNNSTYAVKMVRNSGPNFGDTLILVYENTPKVYSNPGSFFAFPFIKYYNFTAEEMHENDLDLMECEVYQVKENLKFENPWRNVTWKSEEKKMLMERIKSYKPLNDYVSQARLLLIGPVGAGKSSFFNSVKSIFRGHVTSQAMSGTSSTSVTTEFCSFTVKPEHGGKPLPLVICDTMGLEAEERAGLNINEISNLINGHIPDHYQFNPFVSLKRDARGFCKNPKLKDKIHCVAYVIDASKISIMPPNMERKLKAIRKTVNLLRIPQLVLLTKIDEACPLVKEDITNVYKSIYIRELVEEAAFRIGVPVTCVVPVKNYSEELDLDMNIDILLLNAVSQILNLVDDFFDEPRD